MGGLSHLFEFNQRSMARKIHSQKQLGDGLEAPRNSLDFPPETSQSCYAIGDSLPYSYQVKELLPSERNHYSTKASMKKLTRDEVSERPYTRQNSPSIVARLMGIETMPFDSKSVIHPIEKKNKRQMLEHTERCSTFRVPSKSLHHKHMDSDQDGKERDHDQRHNTLKSGKPRPREHPQEKELQKFKKDFEAWQAARVRECSRVLEGGSISQVKLDKEMAEPSRTSKTIASEKLVKPRVHHEKSCLHQMGGLPNHGMNNDLLQVDQELLLSRSRTLSRDFEQVSAMNSGKMDKSFVPSKIVILKPGPDGFNNYEEPYISDSEILEERVSIEDFLDELKAKLKYEMQGKAHRRGNMVRGGGIETPFSEKPSDPKEIAQHIAKQVRESVTRDLDLNLLRLESTRSHRSEIQFDEPGSPEFINRDSRRILSQRLGNVLKKEADVDIPAAVVGRSRVSIHDDDSRRLGQTECTSKTRPDMQAGSFRHGQDDRLLHQEFSPRNLIRSLSAPVPGASFGKLLLEDRHILTGAHIRRKHEAGEIVSVDVKNKKKEKFKFREKVSNLRYSFTLKGRLFNRKIQSAHDSYSSEHEFMNDIMSGPTFVLSSCDSRENSTELPPSPASVCSSALEEVWPVCSAADHLSQISTSDLAMIEDHNIPLIFREISSNLNELRKQLNQLESDGSPEEAALREDPLKAEIVELDSGDRAKFYVRDLLIASGLYIKSSDQMLSMWNPFPKPISMDVYEEVEESYRRLTKEKRHSNACYDLKQVDHKVLHDLLNEALSTVLGPLLSMSGFSRQAMSPPPCGRRLLDRVWEIMSVHLYPSTDRSTFLMDGMVEQDLGSIPWTLTKDEVHAVGIDMEYLVIGDLIEEIVKEMEP